MSKRSALALAMRVRRAQPILERIRRAAGALHLGALERLASSPKYNAKASDRENFEDLKVMVTVGPQLLDHIARDLAALAALIVEPGAAEDPGKEQTPETAEALEWLRRQLDGVGKGGA